jgi:hypothetical protein
MPHTGNLAPHTGNLAAHTGNLAPHTGKLAPHTDKLGERSRKVDLRCVELTHPRLANATVEQGYRIAEYVCGAPHYACRNRHKLTGRLYKSAAQCTKFPAQCKRFVESQKNRAVRHRFPISQRQGTRSAYPLNPHASARDHPGPPAHLQRTTSPQLADNIPHQNSNASYQQKTHV